MYPDSANGWIFTQIAGRMNLMSLIVSDLHTMDLLYEKIIERIPVGIGIFEIPGIEAPVSEGLGTESPSGPTVPLRLIDGNPRFYSFFSTDRSEALGQDLTILVERAFPSEPSTKIFLDTLAMAVTEEGKDRIVYAFGTTIQILVVQRGFGALLIEEPRSSTIQS